MQKYGIVLAFQSVLGDPSSKSEPARVILFSLVFFAVYFVYFYFFG